MSEMFARLEARQGQQVTIRSRVGRPSWITEETGKVLVVGTQRENGAAYVELSSAPIRGLSSNVRTRIYLSAIEEIR